MGEAGPGRRSDWLTCWTVSEFLSGGFTMLDMTIRQYRQDNNAAGTLTQARALLVALPLYLLSGYCIVGMLLRIEVEPSGILVPPQGIVSEILLSAPSCA
jgi:hypothetical protein